MTHDFGSIAIFAMEHLESAVTHDEQAVRCNLRLGSSLLFVSIVSLGARTVIVIAENLGRMNWMQKPLFTHIMHWATGMIAMKLEDASTCILINCEISNASQLRSDCVSCRLRIALIDLLSSSDIFATGSSLNSCSQGRGALI